MSEMSGPSSLPSTPLPTMSHPFFESTGMSNNDDLDNVWGTSSHPSPGSKRCPTFKDYSEKIKQLHQENFQLRVRVFLSEQKSGVKNSSSDFAVLFQQNMQQLQNALNANNPSHSSIPATSSSSSHEAMSAQLISCKAENEQLNSKVIELDEKIAACEAALKDKQIENDHLAEQNEALVDKLQELESEFALVKDKMQQQINQPRIVNASTIDDDELERGAHIAFGLDEFDSYRQLELETKLNEATNKIHQMEDVMSRLQKRLSKSKVTIDNVNKDVASLQNEKKTLQDKLMECAKVLVDFGKRNVILSSEVEKLREEQDDKTRMDQSNVLALDSLMQERFGNVRDLVTMLQGRMKEVVAFVDALFKLESRNVFTIIGLQEDNRERLRVSLEQCRHLSHNLDELFQFTDSSVMADRRLRLAGLNVSNNNDSVSYNSHLYDRRDAGDLDSPSRQKRFAFKEVQCTLLSDGNSSDRSLQKLQRDLIKSENKRRELLSDQTNLRSQLDSLQTNLRSAYDKIEDLEKVNRTLSSQPNTALEMENKSLAERLSITDSALRKMHYEHANLVAKLKQLESMHTSLSQDKLISSYMEAERPSDTTSPDLGIDSGHDAANSDDSHSMNFKLENRELKKTNKELAMKLRHTRQVHI
ncbi:hypothetical protein Fcan01_13889 [Folsomia candida]|uniref:Uncharacterized protein n=1 Tax=Folsomia candida TaxID=158441 RepID=A0A226E2Y1_FOLCA|nr:hypothetical protein Fcan01_13889 [Folsomia candida]